MLTLIKTEMRATTKERLYRMMLDVKALQRMERSELRAAYEYLEAIRDEVSKLLDKVDGK